MTPEQLQLVGVYSTLDGLTRRRDRHRYQYDASIYPIEYQGRAGVLVHSGGQFDFEGVYQDLIYLGSNHAVMFGQQELIPVLVGGRPVVRTQPPIPGANFIVARMLSYLNIPQLHACRQPGRLLRAK